MQKRKRTFGLYVILLLLTLAVAEIIYFSRVNGDKKMHVTEKDPDKPSEGAYIGAETCASCHQKQFDEWNKSHHDMSMAAATTQTVKGAFDTTFTSQGVTSTFYKKANKFFVNTEGPDGQYQDFEIAYTFGVEPLQQYIVQFPDGKLQCLRTAWDADKNKWFDLYPDYKIDPGEWIHWSRGGLNWNTMCADCHSTNVRKNFNEPGRSYQTTFSLIDVSCEACHGAGKQHVEFVSSPEFDSSQHNPKTLISSLNGPAQIDQCAQCHSRRTQIQEGYTPGDNIMDYYVAEVLRDDLYYPDGQIREEVFEYGSFLQSKMYQNNVKCSDCHDSHSLKLKQIGNNLCGQCHSTKRYDSPEHHFHKVNTESSQCINCHMPGRYYMGNDFRRDHSLRVPRPDLSIQYDTPNACNQCHQDKSAEWASKAIEKWYGPDRKPHFSEALTLGSTRSEEAIRPLIALLQDVHQPAIARATAIWYLDQIVTPETIAAIRESLTSKDAIVRYTAVNALAELAPEEKALAVGPLLGDSIQAIGHAAANMLADVPLDQISKSYRKDYQENIRAYEKSLRLRADFPGGQLEKGIFYSRTGKQALAEQAFLNALELDNRFNAARINLAHLYHSQGKTETAIALFKIVIQQEPAFGTAYYSVGLLYAEQQNLYEAVKYLSKAAVLEKNPRVFYNLGLALQQLQQPGKAERTYLEGLQLHPYNHELMYALGILYIQQQEFSKAKAYVERLEKVFPHDPQIAQMMQIIKQRS